MAVRTETEAQLQTIGSFMVLRGGLMAVINSNKNLKEMLITMVEIIYLHC